MPRTFFLFVLLIAAGIRTPAQPVLEEIRPSGGQRGAAARLILKGVSLDSNPRLVTAIPAEITPLSRQKSADGELSYLIEIAADAPFGRYPVRVQTTDGLSNVLFFGVGPFPEIEELESETLAEEFSNDSPRQAQRVSLPVTVQGRLTGPDRDYYSFHATKGQRLVFEVDAERSGSAIDPFIEVSDGAGKRLARSDDAPGLGRDARVEAGFAADGDYFVVVHDQRFSQQKADFYRLTIAEYTYADGVFPLGWRRGEAVEAEFFGGNLPKPRRSKITLDHVPSAAGETLVSVPDSPASLPFVVGDEPEVIEPPGPDPKDLPEGTVVNGRLANRGEVDRYRLNVEAGQKWAFELQSAELDSSDLYGVLTIAGDNNEVIAKAGTYQGDPNPYVISTTGQTSSHPFINLEVPPGVRKLTVSVEDLLQRGGPSFSYRLIARKQPPDFLLTLDTPFVNIPLRGSAVVTVTAERRGYDGSIDLSVPNAPDDIIVQGGHIPANLGLGRTNIRRRFETATITLTPKPGAEVSVLELSVAGRAVLEDGKVIERRAKGPGLMVTVSGTRQEAIRADWLGYELPAMITPEEPAVLEILTARKFRLVLGGKRRLVRWEFTARSGGVRLAKPIVVPAIEDPVVLRVNEENSRPKGGEFAIVAHERTPPGLWTQLSLTAAIRSGGRTRTIYSQPIEINVVDGYSLEPPANELTLSQGGSGEWAGSVRRDAEFTQPVTVKAENLPLGVRCEEAQVGTERTAYVIRCQAAPTTPAGEYEVEILASSKLSDEETTPYNLPPASVKLVVKETTQAANRGPAQR